MEHESGSEQFSLRRAEMANAPILARHRCEMFKDMGELRVNAYRALEEASTAYFATAIVSGEYLSWVVTPAREPQRIVAGGGVQLRMRLPRPDRYGNLEKSGPEVLVLNVYTEQAWRRKGIAEMLMRTILDWSLENGVASLVLHASEMGRPLYERLGFTSGNEMYYPL